jgi:hypothetical protein
MTDASGWGMKVLSYVGILLDMNRLSLSLALIVLAGTSCAATLRVSGTTPVSLSEGSCQYAVESPATSPMWVIARVEGTAFADSLWLAPGTPFTFAWQVPAGIYTVTAYARNQGGLSCPASIVDTAAARPSPVKLTP